MYFNSGGNKKHYFFKKTIPVRCIWQHVGRGEILCGMFKTIKKMPTNCCFRKQLHNLSTTSEKGLWLVDAQLTSDWAGRV